jgi:hypothetical protein
MHVYKLCSESQKFRSVITGMSLTQTIPLTNLSGVFGIAMDVMD